MPTYEYQCQQCERVFEVRQRISEPPLVTCEKCGGAVRRLLSPAPFILKGGGWYVTDYPSESRKKAMEAEKPSSATSTEAKSDGKSSTPDGAAAKTSSGASSSTPPASPSSD